jgi:hypothetical protein
MAVEKKIKKNLSKPKIQVVRNRDNGKRIADSFARLRNEEHPLDIIQGSSLEAENLAIQTNKIGYPNEEILDSNIAKDPNWIAKEEAVLDSNIAKEKNLDSQTSKKTGKWTKYDKARSTTSVFIRAANELVNEIKHFNVENKLDMKEFFELAARSFIDSFGYPNDESLAINIALEDRRQKMFYKTNHFVINLFREYNKIFNPQTDWKPKDDAVGVNYNSVDLRVVEIGIIQTQSNILENESDTKVERFKYYTREIDKFNSLGYSEQLLDAILMTNRKRWKEITGREIDLSFLDKKVEDKLRQLKL